jgi:hypothetical protein
MTTRLEEIMTFKVIIRSLSVWVLIAAAEIIHGILRRAILVPVIGEFRSGQIGAVTGSSIIITITFFTIRWIGAATRGVLIATGFVWLVFMLAFEAYGGRVLAGYSWKRIGDDYDIRKGGLLGFGMLILVFSPLIAAKLRGLKIANV